MRAHAQALACFLLTMEGIADSNPDVTDTDVREAVYLTIEHFFIWGNPVSRFPNWFRMRSPKGNEAVADALKVFVEKMSQAAAAVPLGQERLNLIQDYSVESPGGRKFDEFLGYSAEPLSNRSLPSDLFELGGHDK